MIRRVPGDEDLSGMTDTTSGAWELAVRDRLVARDPSALSDLYDQFGSYVFGLAVRVIGDRHAAASGRSWGRSRTAARSTSSAARKRAAGAPRAMPQPPPWFPTSVSSRWRS